MHPSSSLPYPPPSPSPPPPSHSAQASVGPDEPSHPLSATFSVLPSPSPYVPVDCVFKHHPFFGRSPIHSQTQAVFCPVLRRSRSFSVFLFPPQKNKVDAATPGWHAQQPAFLRARHYAHVKPNPTPTDVIVPVVFIKKRVRVHGSDYVGAFRVAKTTLKPRAPLLSPDRLPSSPPPCPAPSTRQMQAV